MNKQTTRLKISLITLTDIKKFVDAVGNLEGETMIENELGTQRFTAKSFVGAVAAIENWGDVWVVGEDARLYTAVKDFVV